MSFASFAWASLLQVTRFVVVVVDCRLFVAAAAEWTRDVAWP